jgi:hypothetical protein
MTFPTSEGVGIRITNVSQDGYTVRARSVALRKVECTVTVSRTSGFNPRCTDLAAEWTGSDPAAYRLAQSRRTGWATPLGDHRHFQAIRSSVQLPTRRPPKVPASRNYDRAGISIDSGSRQRVATLAVAP